MLFTKLRLRKGWWGGPPGPRGSPWTRFSPPVATPCRTRQAGRGAGCGQGRPPHHSCRYAFTEKYVALGTRACRVPAHGRHSGRPRTRPRAEPEGRKIVAHGAEPWVAGERRLPAPERGE